MKNGLRASAEKLLAINTMSDDRVAAIAAASECGAVSITTSSAPPSVAACKPCGKRV
ncbi:hypothetical protein HED51_23145 [Ochrobactrum grignonense]|nr:hypothetical protein [Brucella grignonensis]